MTVTELRIAIQPRECLWGLPLDALQGAALALIGWVQTENPIDSGVPAAAARALAHSLTSAFNVTYPTQANSGRDVWQLSAEGWERTVHTGITLVCTHQPEAVVRLFDTSHFSWSLKSQVAALSALTAPPPALCYAELRQLLDHRFDWRRLAAEAAIAGLLQPGVDGDFAGLSSFDGGLDHMLAQLQVECQRESIGFRIVTEAEFQQTTWIPQD